MFIKSKGDNNKNNKNNKNGKNGKNNVYFEKDIIQKAERLYFKYRNLMFKEAFAILDDKTLAEDAIMESFERVMKSLHKIDENDVPATRNFLAVICRNVAKDIYKREKQNGGLATAEGKESLDNIEGAYSSVEDIVVRRETLKTVLGAISNLPPDYKDVFMLRRVYGIGREEIANIFGITVPAVKYRLQKAKKMILDELEKEGVEL